MPTAAPSVSPALRPYLEAQDDLIAAFVRRCGPMFAARWDHVIGLYRQGHAGRLFVPNPMTMDLARLLRQFLLESLAAAATIAGDSVKGYGLRQYIAAESLPTSLVYAVEKHARTLAHHEDGDLAAQAMAIIARGEDRAATLERMGRAGKAWQTARLPAIATTESTKAGNTGIVFTTKINPAIRYLRHMSRMDKRTTFTCRMRHLKVLPVDGRLLQFNSPPLHHSCRSFLVPLPPGEKPSRADLEYPNDDLSRAADGFGQLLI